MTVRRTKSRFDWIQRPGIIHLAVVLAYALLTVAMTWPLATSVTIAIPGDGFDGWQNYWNLWWLKQSLIERVANPFVTDILYHPTGVGLYFHTLNPLNGLISMPVQLLAGLIPAYNSVVLVSWVVSGYGMFLLVLWVLRPPREDGPRGSVSARTGWEAYAAAFFAGVIFAFAPFHMAHLLGHMQVMSLEWVPFYVLYLLRGMSRSMAGDAWLRDAGLAGLFLVFNGLSDWYFVLYLFLFTAIAIACYWLAGLFAARKRGVPLGRSATGGLTAALLPPLTAGAFFALALSPVLVPMVREALTYDFMVRPANDLFVLSASLSDYLIPNRLHTLVRPDGGSLPGNQIAPVSERTIAVGYVALVLAGVAMALQRKRAVFWAVAGVFFLLLSMGPAPHLGNITWETIPNDTAEALDRSWAPFAILNRIVPFMRISRSVSRYALMVQLSAAVLTGIGLWTLLRRVKRAAYAVGSVAVISVLFEFWMVPYPLSLPDTPSFYTDLGMTNASGAILNLPMNYDRPGYLLYQTVHGRPLTVAYISRDDPRTMTERVPVLQHFRHLGPDILDGDPEPLASTVLHDLDVEYVILDRYKMPSGREREYTQDLAARIFAGTEPVYSDDRLTAYAVTHTQGDVPYVELGSANWGALKEAGDDKPPSRAVVGGPACFTVRHAAPGMAVEVAYHSEPDSGPSVLDTEGDGVTELPPAPGGATVTVTIGEPGEPDRDPQFCIRTTVAEAVQVEHIRLIGGK